MYRTPDEPAASATPARIAGKSDLMVRLPSTITYRVTVRPAVIVLFLAAAGLRGDSYASLLLQARQLSAGQHFLESLKVLERCLALRRDDPEVYKLVAANAIRLDKLETAETALKKAEQLAPGDHLVHFHLGALYYTQSRFLEAGPELERSVFLRAGYVPAQLFMGLTQEELGGEQNAIQTYRKAIALEEEQGGRSEQPWLCLGRLFYRLNRFSEALPLLHKAAGINARSSEVWLLAGKTYNSLGQVDQAIMALRRAIETDPRNPEPHYVLSRIYVAQHRMPAAGEELARFQDLQARQTRKDDGRRRMPQGH